MLFSNWILWYQQQFIMLLVKMLVVGNNYCELCEKMEFNGGQNSTVKSFFLVKSTLQYKPVNSQRIYLFPNRQVQSRKIHCRWLRMNNIWRMKINFIYFFNIILRKLWFHYIKFFLMKSLYKALCCPSKAKKRLEFGIDDCFFLRALCFSILSCAR